LRHGAQVFHLSTERSVGAIDLRRRPLTILDYQIKSIKHDTGYHLEITLSKECANRFRADIIGLLKLTCTPAQKIERIKNCINDLVERARPARSASVQIKQLQQWLSAKLKPLSATVAEASTLSHLLMNSWLMRVDNKLYVKAPSFFFDPKMYDEKTYTAFFSPFREV